MKKINFNKDNLKESDITEIVRRVKVLIINSKNEILLGYSHNNYQFPGGHVENGERLTQTINREITEETGIELNVSDSLKPFACYSGYYKDYPEVGKNRKAEIYYYEIKTDQKPNLAKTEYTENEKDGGFNLQYVPLDHVEIILKENEKLYGDKRGIAKEMLELLDIYKYMK